MKVKSKTEHFINTYTTKKYNNIMFYNKVKQYISVNLTLKIYIKNN